MKRNYRYAVALGLSLMACTAVEGFAATKHFANGESLGSRPSAAVSWEAWKAEWPVVASDFTKVSLAPGKNETELNFAWMSRADSGVKPTVRFGTDPSKMEEYKGSSEEADPALTGGVKYVSNKVTVTGLKPETTYYYAVDGQSAKVYRTGSFETVSFLYVGDPQIGASKGQVQGGTKLVPESGSANTAARNDAFGWERTLNLAVSENKNLNFVLSAGDQVNKTGKPKEEEFAGYLNPKVLEGLPVATTIGNHDSLNPDYRYHFNTPNMTKLGATAAGGDYYFSYGSALFVVLNTNNYNAAEHDEALKQAVASDPDAKWRIVSMHQDIYGSGLDHSDSDGMILRTQLTPIFDKYDVDVVLQGHDHTYSRSKMLYGDGKTHQKYAFSLNEKGDDYDWDHAVNTVTKAKIALNPKDDDTAAKNALADFQNDNKCYVIEDVSGNEVVNPKGTLYMEANSASGSKYYELIAAQQDYIAVRSQNWLPSYSVVTVTPERFMIDTYQVTDEGKTEKIDDTFSIVKKAK
jgi:hypothetical protein